MRSVVQFYQAYPRTTAGVVAVVVVAALSAAVLAPTLFKPKRYVLMEESWPVAAPQQFFLGREPVRADYDALPGGARDIYTAWVRVVKGPTKVARSQGDTNKGWSPAYWMEADVKIVGVIEGNVALGDVQTVRFAEEMDRHFTYPRSETQKVFSYPVISYVDHRGTRQLMALPLSMREYVAWMREPKE